MHVRSSIQFIQWNLYIFNIFSNVFGPFSVCMFIVAIFWVYKTVFQYFFECYRLTCVHNKLSQKKLNQHFVRLEPGHLISNCSSATVVASVLLNVQQLIILDEWNSLLIKAVHLKPYVLIVSSSNVYKLNQQNVLQKTLHPFAWTHPALEHILWME